MPLRGKRKCFIWSLTLCDRRQSCENIKKKTKFINNVPKFWLLPHDVSICMYCTITRTIMWVWVWVWSYVFQRDKGSIAKRKETEDSKNIPNHSISTTHQTSWCYEREKGRERREERGGERECITWQSCDIRSHLCHQICEYQCVRGGWLGMYHIVASNQE